MSAAGLYHPAQFLGVVKQRAGTEVIVIERLPLVVLQEKRGTQNIENRRLADICCGIMYESTRLGVAVRINVEITPTA